jgi:hypothetical protein
VKNQGGRSSRPPKPDFGNEKRRCKLCGQLKSLALDFATEWAKDHWSTRHQCTECREPGKHPRKPGSTPDRLAQIRLSDRESKRKAMLNAPRDEVNIPLIQRMDVVQKALAEIMEINPDDAATMVSPWRCRQFMDSKQAEWWSKVTEACTKRFTDVYHDDPGLV